MDDVAVPLVDPLKTDRAAKRLVVGLTNETRKSTAAVMFSQRAVENFLSPVLCGGR
jgi:hypothetical protein